MECTLYQDEQPNRSKENKFQSMHEACAQCLYTHTRTPRAERRPNHRFIIFARTLCHWYMVGVFRAESSYARPGDQALQRSGQFVDATDISIGRSWDIHEATLYLGKA